MSASKPRRRRLRGKRLLVASFGMAALSYAGCGPEEAPPGNLVAPPVEEHPPGNLVAPPEVEDPPPVPPVEDYPPGNLVPPPDIVEDGPVVPEEPAPEAD